MATYALAPPSNDGYDDDAAFAAAAAARDATHSPAPPQTQLSSSASAANTAEHRRRLVDRLVGHPPARSGIPPSAKSNLYRYADNPALTISNIDAGNDNAANYYGDGSKHVVSDLSTSGAGKVSLSGFKPVNAGSKSSSASTKSGNIAGFVDDDSHDSPRGFAAWLASLPLLRDLPLPGLAPNHNGELGGPTLGYWSSVILLVNNITGPGMLALPLAYTKGGIVLTSLLLLFFALIGNITSIFVSAAISRVPPHIRASSNERLEFCPLVSHYLDGKHEWATQLLYNFSLQVKTMASIVISAQVMDKFCVWAFGTVHALQVYPVFSRVTDDASHIIPFEALGADAFVITAGYLLSVLMFMPLGLLNMDENIIFQWVAGAIMAVVLCEFGTHFAASDLQPDAVPWGVGPAVMVTVGVTMFCYTFIDTVPSWYNEKKPTVSTTSALTVSVSASTVIYLFLGIFGAMCFPNITSGNVLELLADKRSSIWVQVSTYIFSLSTIGLGIPIFCIIMRYNLYVGKIASSRWAKVWGVFFPWAVSFLLYQGTAFVRFVNWTSLIFTNFTNFILPAYIYLLALRKYPSARGLVARSGYDVGSNAYTHSHKSRSGKGSAHTGLTGMADDGESSEDEYIRIGEPTRSSGKKVATRKRTGKAGAASKSGSGLASESRGLTAGAGDDDSDDDLELGVDAASPNPNGPSFSALLDTSAKPAETKPAAAVSKSGLDMSLFDAGALGFMDDDDTNEPAPAAAAAAAAVTEAKPAAKTKKGKGAKGTKGKRAKGSSGADAEADDNDGDEGAQDEGVIQLPGPVWFHKLFPNAAPMAVIIIMSLVSIVAIGIDLYYLIVHGQDLTDI